MTNRVNSGRIYNCHKNKEVFKMFYDEQQAYNACSEDPSLIFRLIKQGCYDVIDALADKNKIDVNLCDVVGNDVVTKLLKVKQYDLVLKLIKKRNWNVNHQNDEGDTFAHVLAVDNSISTLGIISQLVKKKNFMPNIRNNNGETALDKAVNNNYMLAAFKILEDKRFNCIDVFTFRKLYNSYVKSSSYGKYSSFNNLNVILKNLEKKELVPSMEKLIFEIKENIDSIREDIMRNGFSILDDIINSSLVGATV